MRNVSFDVRYSFHLETMMATLYRRLEYLLYFILMLAGGLVLADVGNTALQGLVVIIVAFTALTLRPARNALLCESQAARYRELMHDLSFIRMKQSFPIWMKLSCMTTPQLAC